MGNGELKKPDLEFHSVNSIPLRLVNSNNTEILWYVFRPKEVGQHEVLFSWADKETAGQIPQNSLPFYAKAILYENGVGIRSKEYNSTNGVINFGFESIQPTTIYFLKVITQSACTYSLETRGLFPTNISIIGDTAYNEGMFELLLNLLTTEEMDVEYFSNWYKLLFGAQGLKYKLIGVLVNKVTNGDISPAIFQAEYNCELSK